MKYFLEIRNRIILIVLNYFSSLLVCYYYKEILLFFLVKSYSDLTNANSYFIFTGIAEVFSIYIEVIIFVSSQISLLYIFYTIFIFLAPALFFKEYNFLKFILYLFIGISICFVFLSTIIIIPMIWNFFVSFQTFSVGQSFYFEAKLTEYFKFYVSTYHFCLFYGQVFFLSFLFLNNIYLKLDYIKKYRKLYYYLFITFSTTITPPDVLSQISISLCLMILYEFAIFIFMTGYFFKKLTR
jgi:sec-independent protein translocase protein TatC